LTAGLLTHHRIKGLEEELGDTLGGDGIDDERTKKLGVILQELLPDGVRFGEEARVVEVVGDPGLQETQAAEVDDEPTLIETLATELDLDAPVVTVQEGTMPVMPMLPVGERDVAVGLAAGEHGTTCR
jgi:hypothetical protein